MTSYMFYVESWLGLWAVLVP